MAGIGGSYELGYTPGRTAVGRSRFSPGQVGGGLEGGGFNLGELMKEAWWRSQQAKEEDMHRQLRMDQAMRTRAASGQRSGYQGQDMPLRDLMQTKGVLDQMRTGPQYGTNQQFFNMPAAASLTGMQLPRSGFDTYAMLAGSAPSADPEGVARARAIQSQTQGLSPDFPRTGVLADAAYRTLIQGRAPTPGAENEISGPARTRGVGP
jgi:hypothetical protein